MAPNPAASWGGQSLGIRSMKTEWANCLSLFVMMFTNGDLPTNPMCVRECMVCGEVFNRIDSLAHTEIPCQPSPLRPLAAAGRDN
jgi:hypothetical protein